MSKLCILESETDAFKPHIATSVGPYFFQISSFKLSLFARASAEERFVSKQVEVEPDASTLSFPMPKLMERRDMSSQMIG